MRHHCSQAALALSAEQQARLRDAYSGNLAGVRRLRERFVAVAAQLQVPWKLECSCLEAAI
jgi:hypothetical protein